MAIRKLPGRRRGPMSLAQKAALKKAQEASARARRGTGKVELKKRRPTAKDYRAQGDKQAREMGMLDRGGSDSRKLKKAIRGSDITRDATPSRANNPRTKFDRNSGNQTVTRFTPKQRAAGFRKGAGLKKTTPAPAKKIDDSSTYESLPKSNQKVLRSVAPLIEKINNEIVGSENMRMTANALFVSDGEGGLNDLSIRDFLDGIDEAILEMDDLWQGSAEERAARKKLTALKTKLKSMVNGK